MDRQVCTLEIESYGYTMSDIRYKWNDGMNSVQISPDVSLPQFQVLGFRQKSVEAILSTGNYSRLSCEVQFVRQQGYYITQVYLPSSMIVIVSWVSFYINRASAPARVGLGVTTVLTMTTLIGSTNRALPKVSYIKSIDIYLGFCFFMVFAALLEYASVGYLTKRILVRKLRFDKLQKIGTTILTQWKNKRTASNNDALSNKVPDQHDIRKSPVASAKLAKQCKSVIARSNHAASSNEMDDQHGTQKQTSALFKDHDATMRREGGSQKHTTSPYNQAGGDMSKNQTPDKSPSTSRDYDKKGHPSPRGRWLLPGPRCDPPPQTLLQPPLFLPRRPLASAQHYNKQEQVKQDMDTICGMRGSDIDRYSRVIFPVTFLCFQLTYWIIYLHMSRDTLDELVYFQQD